MPFEVFLKTVAKISNQKFKWHQNLLAFLRNNRFWHVVWCWYLNNSFAWWIGHKLIEWCVMRQKSEQYWTSGHDPEKRLELLWSLADCGSQAWVTISNRIMDLSYSIVVASDKSLFAAKSVSNQAAASTLKERNCKIFRIIRCWTRKCVEIVNLMFENIYGVILIGIPCLRLLHVNWWDILIFISLAFEIESQT